MSETEKPTKTTKTPKVKIAYDDQLNALLAGKSLFEQLEILVVEAKKQYTKAQKPNKAAGVRARKAFQRGRNTGKLLRDEVTNWFPKKEKVVKPSDS